MLTLEQLFLISEAKIVPGGFSYTKYSIEILLRCFPSNWVLHIKKVLMVMWIDM